MSQMTLADLEMALRPLREDLVFVDAFGEPSSYRGFYEELAFRPASDKTVRELRDHVKAGYGVFMGYKGGTYLMSGKTRVNIAQYGECGIDDEDELTFKRFQQMLDYAKDSA